MYRRASQYLFPSNNDNNIREDFITQVPVYVNKEIENIVEKDKKDEKKDKNEKNEKVEKPEVCNSGKLHMKMVKNKNNYTCLTSPQVWGPPLWFSLHVSSANYPVNPSEITKKNTKARILALPFELPCVECRLHANNFISSKNLDDIVSSKNKLFAFYVEFHNKVNERQNKPLVSLEEAKKMYEGGIGITRIDYA